jgi:hydroxypyruvate isomerase
MRLTSTSANPSRRTFLGSIAAGLAARSVAFSKTLCSSDLPAQDSGSDGKRTIRRFRQSVARWCFEKLSLEDLCANSAQLGLQGIDLLNEDEWEIPKRFGMICSIGYGGGGQIEDALNCPENHARIEAAFRRTIPLAAKSGVENLITFSGNRKGMSDEEGAKNTIAGLNRVKRIAEDHGVTICMELLNSKRDHKDYMCDHSAWGVRVVHEVNSPHVKLLYDIYHMQIMEGDLIRTIVENIDSIGHFHTGGVPGRHELDNQQEVNWIGVMRAITGTNFKGFVGHEFVPVRDPLCSLAEAIQLCNV